MDVGPVSSGPAGTNLAPGPGAVAGVAKPGASGTVAGAQAPAVLDSAILEALAQPDLARLVTILEPPQGSQNAARAGELLQAAITASIAGDAVRALEGVAELVALDPLRAEAVRTEPGLKEVHAQLEALLTRVANVAKLDAETRVGEAAHAVETGLVKALPEWEARPEALLSIANRLLDAGGHLNSVRAMKVAQVVIEAAHWVPAAATVPPGASATAGVKSQDEVGRPLGVIVPALGRGWASLRKRGPARLAVFWRRAPLLVLLLAWLAAGTAGGVVSWIQQRLWPEAWPGWLTEAGFSLWGLGFLALVLFGFYIRVRNVRL
jgi:hypothetical protein